jgi:hypothetical protein
MQFYILIVLLAAVYGDCAVREGKPRMFLQRSVRGNQRGTVLQHTTPGKEVLYFDVKTFKEKSEYRFYPLILQSC